MAPAPPQRRSRFWPLALLAGILTAPAAYLASVYYRETERLARPAEEGAPVEASEAEVRQFCAACHAFPPPDSLPREVWAKEVGQAFRFAHEAGLTRGPVPALPAVVRYYERRAPERLALEPAPELAASLPVRLDRGVLPLPGDGDLGVLTCVRVVALTREPAAELLACDARTNQVLLADLADPKPAWRVIASASHPARVEVADLDGDGVRDVLVANLGVYFPTDETRGGVVWLRGGAGGSFTPVTLIDGLGRVADVRVADFTGDGKPDLAVAVFGWRATGELVLLENRATDPARPAFEKRVIDPRHGASELAVADLNADGRPDLVCLFAQEHEQVVAYLNDGRGGFRAEAVYQGPHPDFGSSGLELADLDGDGDLDVVLANGDILDQPVLKPHHGVRWLENTGRYPFAPHRLGQLCGVIAARTGDLDGDGDLDIAAVCYLPARDFPGRDDQRLPGVVLYEQVARGRFRPLVLETGRCDNISCAVARLPGDVLPSLVVGHGDFVKETGRLDAVTVWRNRGRH